MEPNWSHGSLPLAVLIRATLKTDLAKKLLKEKKTLRDLK